MPRMTRYLSKLCALGLVESARQSFARDVSHTGLRKEFFVAAVERELICTLTTLVLAWTNATGKASIVALKGHATSQVISSPHSVFHTFPEAGAYSQWLCSV